MNIRFEIDKARQDSFYHYKKYDDTGACVKTGWSIWSRQNTDEEKDAWLIAVQEYQESHHIQTEATRVKNFTASIRDKIKLDASKVENKKPLMMPQLKAIIDAFNNAGVGDCSDDYVAQVLGLVAVGVPTPKAVFQYTWNATWFNAEIDLQKLMIDFKNLGITGFLYPLLDLVDKVSDDIVGAAVAVWGEVLKLAANAVYYYNQMSKLFGCKGKEDEAEEYRKKFKEELKDLAKKFGQVFVDFLYRILCIQAMIDMLQVVKSGISSTANAWRSVANKLRSLTTDDLKEINKKAWEEIKSLLPMLASLAGAFIIMKCMQEEERKQSLQTSADALGVTPDELETTLNKSVKEYQEALSGAAIVYNKAVNNIDNYSLFPTHIQAVTNVNQLNDTSTVCSQDECNCKVSMCDLSDPIDADNILSNNTIGFSSAVVIEIQNTLNYRFTVSEGSTVNTNDIIAYINDVPVKSNSNYKILELHDNYVIAEETTNQEILDSSTAEDAEVLAQNMIQRQLDNVDLTEYNNIVDTFKMFAYSDTFIRQYISYYRFPELAQYTREHTDGNVTEMSTDDFIEEYESYADKHYSLYEKEVKSITKAKNIKKAVKKGKITEIKKQLDEAKNKFNSNILDLYNSNPGNIKFCSKGRLMDYMLYSNYINYLTSDRFEYDEDNPYIKRIYDKITSFIGTRTRIELNADNIKPLYAKFNEYCVKYLSFYWQAKDKDYYTTLSDLFKYDYYVDSIDIIEDTTGVGLTLYKRVLNYLKAVTKFTPDKSYAIEVNESSDINKILEEQGKMSSESSYNKDKFNFEKKLKQIAYRFTAIRKIELALNDNNITSHITTSQWSKFNALRKAIGDIIFEYDENKVYKKKELLYNKKSIINPILNELKKQTAKEAAELREITKDCIDWYNDNAQYVMQGEMFKSFVQISWPDPSTIYRNNEKMDYYLFTTLDNENLVPPKDQNEIEKLEDSIGEIPDDGDIDVTDPNTAARMYDMKYWLKYCGIASVVGAMIPPFWSTGIPFPITLPIVYIPFAVVKGRVTLVAGMGVCGMSILPMLMFVNTSTVNGVMLLPINDAIDAVVKQLKQVSNAKLINAKTMFRGLLNSLNIEVNRCEAELEDIKYQMSEIRKVPVNPEAELIMKTLENEDTSFKSIDAINMTSDDVEAAEFVAYVSPDIDVDYNKIIENIDKMTVRNDEYRSLEDLANAYGTLYQSSASGGTLGRTDGDFTFEKFEEVCKATNCKARTDVYEAIVAAFNDSLKSLTINDYDKTADLSAYLANTAIECGFRPVRESTNYSETSILKTWKKSYFNSDGSPTYRQIKIGSNTISIKTARQYASDGINLFNYVYGTVTGKLGRYGNNSWGDGYKYRGGGFTQLTFKSAYAEYNTFCNNYFGKNFNIVANPDNICNVDAAAYTSVAFWINKNGSRNLHNVWTENPNISSEITKICPDINDMPCTSTKYPGVFKPGVTDTEKKFAACFALVAGHYPTDTISETSKNTYIKKLNAFIKIYKILAK